MTYCIKQGISFLSLCFLCPFFIQAQQFELEEMPKDPISIRPGEEHSYRVKLSKEEILFVRFQQEGADVEIRVFDPAAELMEEFDGNNGKYGPELLILIPEESGIYDLKVRPLAEQKKVGNYKVSIDQKLRRGSTPEAELDQIIQYWADQGYLPGFATAVITSDQVLFQKAYGYAKLDEKKAYSLSSIQNIGSVSKTLIGISLMIAVEEGKLKLEDEINQYLPFEVKNPHYPEIPITIKQLANHTSSIAEMEDYERTYVLHENFRYTKGEISKGEYKEMKFYAENETMDMGTFLEALLAKGGKYYKKKNFLKQAPASRYSYSNAGATLAAYIVERVYHMPYHEFTKKRILEPLKMEDSRWLYSQLAKEKLSDRHFFNRKPIPPYSLITYPDGGLMTDCKDLITYLQFLMKGYEGNARLISPASFQEMMKPQLSQVQQQRKDRNYGFFWEFWENDMGHNGGDPGAVCLIRFNPETGVGRILLCNIIPAHPMSNKAFSSIWRYLDSYGEKLSKEK